MQKNEDLESLTLTKVHVNKNSGYGSWACFHNKKGLGFCFELRYSYGDEDGEGAGDYIFVYKQTKAEAKLGLKGRKLDVSHIYQTPEYKALYPLMDKAETIIREECSKVWDLGRKKDEEKVKKKQSKEISYIQKVTGRTE